MRDLVTKLRDGETIYRGFCYSVAIVKLLVNNMSWEKLIHPDIRITEMPTTGCVIWNEQVMRIMDNIPWHTFVYGKSVKFLWSLGFFYTTSQYVENYVKDRLEVYSRQKKDKTTEIQYTKAGLALSLLLSILNFSNVSWSYVECVTPELVTGQEKWRRGFSCPLPEISDSNELEVTTVEEPERLILTRNDVIESDWNKPCLKNIPNPLNLQSDFIKTPPMKYSDRREVVRIITIFKKFKFEKVLLALDEIRNAVEFEKE